jgi:hypothetical protein
MERFAINGCAGRAVLNHRAERIAAIGQKRKSLANFAGCGRTTARPAGFGFY